MSEFSKAEKISAYQHRDSKRICRLKAGILDTVFKLLTSSKNKKIFKAEADKNGMTCLKC